MAVAEAPTVLFVLQSQDSQASFADAGQKHQASTCTLAQRLACLYISARRIICLPIVPTSRQMRNAFDEWAQHWECWSHPVLLRRPRGCQPQQGKPWIGRARQAQSPATLLPFDLNAPYTERHVSCRLRMCEAKFSLRPFLVRRHIRKHIVFMLTKFNFQMKKGERGQVHETNSTNKRCQRHVTPRKLHAGLAAHFNAWQDLDPTVFHACFRSCCLRCTYALGRGLRSPTREVHLASPKRPLQIHLAASGIGSKDVTTSAFNAGRCIRLVPEALFKKDFVC